MIGVDSEQLGVMSSSEAQEKADDAGLDLVEKLIVEKNTKK